MLHNILLTGASGYLGGSLLTAWSSANLPPHGALFALVRSDVQADAVRMYGAEPLRIDISDADAVRRSVVKHNITTVLWLIDAVNWEGQILFIDALAEVKRNTGKDVHLIHTSGAKLFSSHAGAPTDAPFSDTAPDLFDVQKAQVATLPMIQTALATSNAVIEAGEHRNVNTYIFVPPIVYGKGRGFGNTISIHTTAIVRAARAQRRVYSVDDGRPTWPVCHIEDNTNLYLQLIRRILEDSKPPSGRDGYYLAASGSIAWEDLYAKIAIALAKRGEVTESQVQRASGDALAAMGAALGCSKELVPLQLGGLCTFTGQKGETIGWEPSHRAEHILEVADEEVDYILTYLHDH